MRQRSRRIVLTTAALVMAACSAALASPAAAAPHTDKIRTESAGTFRNPIKRDAADPWIQFYQGSYYMTETRADRITITKASSVADLAAAPETMVWQSTAPNRCCNLWAPELHLVDGRWYLYYTDVDEPVAAAWGVHPRDTSHHRMYVLQSAGTDPLGPYTFKGVLNTTIEAFAIDGTMFERPDGSLYFIWSGASDATSSAQNLYIAPMSNPWTISGSRVLLSEPTYDWERRPRPLAPASFAINEGPAVLQHDGRVFLTYSASACDLADYALGMLTLTPGGDPVEPKAWTKSATPVFHRSDAHWVFSTGHNGFFTSPDGRETWIVYHGVTPSDSAPVGACDARRSARIQRVTFNDDGTPNFGVPAASWDSLALPSGDPGSTPVLPGRYEITTQLNGNALSAGCSAGATEVTVMPYQDTACQHWDLRYLGGGSYELASAGRALLGVAGCAPDNGAAVDVRPDANIDCQKWYLDTVGDGQYRISSRGSGKALDSAGCSSTDPARVDMWPYWGDLGGCQVWQLTRLG